MKKRLMRWLLPLIAILAITIVMVLNVSLSKAHAAPTHIASPASSGVRVPDSFWRG